MSIQFLTGNMPKAFPLYKCHKIVGALKISTIQEPPSHPLRTVHGALLSFVEDGYEPLYVTPEFMQKHGPQPGGYYVVYEDGYTSFSPADAFEAGYNSLGTDYLTTEQLTTMQENDANYLPVAGLSFGQAIQALSAGLKVYREVWGAGGAYLVRQKGYPHGVNINKNTAEALNLPDGTTVAFSPYLLFCEPRGMGYVTEEGYPDGVDLFCTSGWRPLYDDMFATDWHIVVEKQSNDTTKW